ncbi:TPA: hypothetical protein ACTR19_002535 [Yersinia enterocolitica]|nr:hypothetical protein [Yersinia enterocolitica]HDL8438313.1 hypothetical protein [Yersinia enterocolitica]HDM8456696.1 hypothetical protein [Yersinia enterocolitica]HDW8047743.1 hypothetical protein [Yersinia enterocolitica]HEF9705859.1 hypothetical protein [Yersinia enterocolitica]
MNAAEFYAKFEIKPAKYNQNESHFDFVKRVISSNPSEVEQAGVTYSSGSSHTGNNDVNSNGYVMYSY